MTTPWLRTRLAVNNFLTWGALAPWQGVLADDLDRLGFTPLEITLTWASSTVANLVSTVWIGRLADRRFSAEDSLPVPTSKPDPAIYAYALHALGLRADQALAVEDSPTGATAAVAAGIPTVGNLQFVQADEVDERREQLTAVGVVALVDSWDELLGLLG